MSVKTTENMKKNLTYSMPGHTAMDFALRFEPFRLSNIRCKYICVVYILERKRVRLSQYQ